MFWIIVLSVLIKISLYNLIPIMKPIKNLEPFAKWVIRIGLFLFLVSMYHNQIQLFSYKNVDYVINMIYLLSGASLLLGGFQKKVTLTIISGIFVTFVSGYKTYIAYAGNLLNSDMYVYLIILGIGIFFCSKGN